MGSINNSLNDPLREALVKLNAEYAAREASAPSEGYRVLFEEKPVFKAILIPEGALRKGTSLTGLPQNEEDYRANQCVFCKGALKVHKKFQESLAIISQTQQVLIIPRKHYAHWFAAPIDEQVLILKQALSLRKENPGSIRLPMGLHCGAAGGQTVFHLHFRTGLYVNN